MTLDETIETYEESAKRFKEFADYFDKDGSLAIHLNKYSAEYKQLTEWLRELRDYRRGKIKV